MHERHSQSRAQLWMEYCVLTAIHNRRDSEIRKRCVWNTNASNFPLKTHKSYYCEFIFRLFACAYKKCCYQNFHATDSQMMFYTTLNAISLLAKANVFQTCRQIELICFNTSLNPHRELPHQVHINCIASQQNIAQK